MTDSNITQSVKQPNGRDTIIEYAGREWYIRFVADVHKAAHDGWLESVELLQSVHTPDEWLFHDRVFTEVHGSKALCLAHMNVYLVTHL